MFDVMPPAPDEQARVIPRGQILVCSKCGAAVVKDALRCTQCDATLVAPTEQPAMAHAGSSRPGIAILVVAMTLFACALLAQIASSLPSAAPVASDTLGIVGGPSGGLGVTRATWEARYGSGTALQESGGAVRYRDDVLIYYSQEGHMQTIERRWRTLVTLDIARQQMQRLFPTDAVHVRTYAPTVDTSYVVDVYRSTWLQDRFADIKIVNTPISPWVGGEPGSFFVMYRVHNGALSSAVLGLGDAP